MSQKTAQKHSLTRSCTWRRPLAVLAMALGLSVLALAQSQEFPTYTPGENTNATTGPTYSAPLTNPWVVSDGTIITPAGTQVYLGTTTRAKAIALNPTATEPLLSFRWAPRSPSRSSASPPPAAMADLQQGQVMQNYIPSKTNSGSSMGITYTPNGQYLVFSQDGDYGPAYVAIASVARPACSPITLRSASRSTSTAAAI